MLFFNLVDSVYVHQAQMIQYSFSSALKVSVGQISEWCRDQFHNLK